MENRIKSELRGRKPNEVTDLFLDNCNATRIKGLTEEFVNLELLSLSKVGLTTLKGFPALPNLKRVDLSDNAITGTLSLLAGSPDLSYLNLCRNKIKDFRSIKPLEKFTQLTSLELAGCEVAKKKGYPKKIFELVSSLLYLDGYDKDDKKEPEIVLSMDVRIECELGDHMKHEVLWLTLDNCMATQIQGLTDEFVNLEILTMPGVGLMTLEGFPLLPKLKELDLSDNAITGTLDLLAGSPDLSHLNLSGNKIKDLETVKPLEKFTQLTSLDLAGCEVAKNDDYREKIFELIPSLVVLDRRLDVDGIEEVLDKVKRPAYTPAQSRMVTAKLLEEKAAALAAGLSLQEYRKREEEKDQKECEKRMAKLLEEDEDEESEGEGEVRVVYARADGLNNHDEDEDDEEGDEVSEDEDEISDEEDGAEGQNNHAGPSGKKPNEKKPHGKKHAEEDEDGEDD